MENKAQQLLPASRDTLVKFLFVPRDFSNGIENFKSVKFYLAFAAYMGSFLMFANDYFFREAGKFSYDQGAVTIFLAFICVASFCWERCIFGKAQGANLFLHVAMIPAVALLLARILSTPTVPVENFSWWHDIIESVKSINKGLNILPVFVRDIIVNWKIVIFLFLVLFILSVKKEVIRWGVLLSLVAIPFCGAIVEAKGDCWNLLCGTFLLAAGMALQYCPYSQVAFFENAIKKIFKSKSTDKTVFAVEMRILDALNEQGNLSEETVLRIIKGEYQGNGLKLSMAEWKLLASEIVRRMVYEHRVAFLQSTNDGISLYADWGLYTYSNALAGIAVCPRIILSGLVGLIVLISPFDLIPDAIPMIGYLDDVFFLGLTVWGSYNSLEGIKGISAFKRK